MYNPKYAAPPTEKEIHRVAELKQKLTKKLLDDDTSFLLDDYTFLRFLRKGDGKVDKGLMYLEACIDWRNTFKPHRITYEEVEERIHKLNKWYLLGLTKDQIPVFYMKPRPCHDPKDQLIDTKTVCWIYEEIHRRGYREICSVVDASTYDRLPSKAERQAEEYLENLSFNYYPLVDSRVLLMNLPVLIRPILAITMALMNSAQRHAMKTGVKPKNLIEHISQENISEEYGGSCKVMKLSDNKETYDVLRMLDHSIPVWCGVMSSADHPKLAAGKLESSS